MGIVDDTTFIVREAGERTSDACVQRLEDVVGRGRVQRVCLAPFSEAVRQSLRLGIREGRPWTLCIDADVLVQEEGLMQLLGQLPSLPPWAFELQGRVFDKFFALQRPAGNHIFRTSLAARAIELIPQEGSSLRPESTMVNAMEARGYPWVQSETCVGLHDFEQFHADIYRKCFLQAHKHNEHGDYLAQLWSALADSDPDFRVAQAGYAAGRAFDGTVLVSRDFLAGQVETALSSIGLSEKEARVAVDDFAELRRRLVARLPPHLQSVRDGLEPRMMSRNRLLGAIRWERPWLARLRRVTRSAALDRYRALRRSLRS